MPDKTASGKGTGVFFERSRAEIDLLEARQKELLLNPENSHLATAKDRQELLRIKRKIESLQWGMS